MRYSRRVRPRLSDSMLVRSPRRGPSASITAPWCVSSTSTDSELERLAGDAVDLAQHDARPRHRQLVAFAAHVLDQDREVQLAAARHQERIGVAGLLDAQRDVGQHLLREPVAQVARRHVLAFAAGERRRVDLEVHRQRRLVDHDRRQRLRRVDRRQRRADRELVDAGDEHDVAGLRRLDRHALHARRTRTPASTFAFGGDLALRRAGRSAPRLPARRRGGRGGCGRCPAARRSSSSRARLTWNCSGPSASPTGAGHVREDRLEQRAHVGAFRRRVRLRDVRRRASPSRSAPTRRRPGNRAASSVAPSRSKSSNVWLTTHSGRAPGRSTLFTTTIGCRPELQRLQRDEARLRHRPFDRVDQQQHAVDHAQHALDLAAEVGVARACRRC